MRSSSKLVVIMNPSWKHQWPIPPSLNTDDLSSNSTVILVLHLLVTLLRRLIHDTSLLGLKVRRIQIFYPVAFLSILTVIETTPTPAAAPYAPYPGGEQTIPYRPASHSPDPRNQIQAGVPPVQQHTPQPDPYQAVHHRPQSTFDHPQELGTSVYDSPVDQPASAQRLPYPQAGQTPGVGHQQLQQQQQDYSPSAYSPEDPPQAPPASIMPQIPHQFQQQQQQHQAPYPNSPDAQQPPPSHQPPPVPSAAQPQYTSYTPPAPAPASEYQAYQPQGGAAGSNPASFYR